MAQKDERVLVLCASPAMAEHMQNMIARNLEESDKGNETVSQANLIQVMTAREVAWEIMSDPATYAHDGRKPHLFDSLESDLLFEDMKPLGIKRRRLRELLAFIYRGFNDRADDDPDWIKTTEEEACIDLLRKNLCFTGSIIAEQLHNLASRALENDTQLRQRHVRTHVIVDDYLLIGRASQAIANLLADKSIAIAADESSSATAEDQYPYREGLDEFFAANPHAQTQHLDCCHRPAHIVSVIENLLADESAESAGFTTPIQDENAANTDLTAAADDESESIQVHMASDLVEECRWICETVTQIKDGESDVNDILIVGMNAVWRLNVARALGTCDIPVTFLGKKHSRLDYSTVDLSSPIAQKIVSRIATNEDDSAAWRTWCAFGDALGASASIAQLRDRALSQDLQLAEALKRLSRGSLDGADAADVLLAPLKDAYIRGLSAAANVQRHCEAAERHRLAEAQDLDNNAHYPANRDRATSAAGGPNVLMASPQDLLGCEADLVIFGGFVNGFIPSREHCDTGVLVGEKRKREDAANRQAMRSCLASARKQIIFSGFTSCGLETAERLNLHVARIILRDSVRTSIIEPSDMLDYL